MKDATLDHIRTLCSISNGTLLTCCKESGFNVSSNYDDLDKIRQEWTDFLIHHKEKTISDCPTWVDAWLLFSKNRNKLSQRAVGA